jgi:hypothetical protein
VAEVSFTAGKEATSTLEGLRSEWREAVGIEGRLDSLLHDTYAVIQANEHLTGQNDLGDEEKKAGGV